MPQDQNKAIKVGLCLGLKGTLVLSTWGLTSPEVTKQQQKESPHPRPSGQFTPGCPPTPTSSKAHRMGAGKCIKHGPWMIEGLSLVTRAGRTPAPSCAHRECPWLVPTSPCSGGPHQSAQVTTTECHCWLTTPWWAPRVQTGTGPHAQ